MYIPDPPKQKKKIGRKILLAILIIWGISKIELPIFESNPPQIEIDKFEYWNLQKPINLTIYDESGIRDYEITMDNGDGELFKYDSKTFETPDHKKIELNITMPKEKKHSTYATIFVKATDFSNWHFFKGNKSEIQESYIVDRQKPIISIIAASYGIRRGGVAVVIFKVDDKRANSISDVYIETQKGKKFIPQPFFKEGGKYYISLLAWPINDISFKANIVAKDKAGNVATNFINLYLKEKQYRRSTIHLKDSFLSGKISALAQRSEKSQETDSLTDYFKIVNEDIRKENEDLIYKITSQVDKYKLISDFKMYPFRPLKGYAPVASFGDHRKYYYDEEFVSEAFHMGLDLASIKHAPIILSNRGEIVFNEDNGVYGTTIIVSHGLGFYTLYSHCSSVRVQVGDLIDRGSTIANTGKTGLALGDHLHFGIYVQGIPVRPEEWMDKKWMKNNITDVIETAKKLIERN